MSKANNLVNLRFERLIVLSRAENDKKGNARWLCRCDCGKVKTIRGYHLTSGKILSCGCLQKEVVSKVNTTHGNRKERLYNEWRCMLYRCNNLNHISYEYYGAKGITVCNEWNDYDCFKSWSLENGYNDELTIDRIDVSGDYCPSNCRWITHKEQQYNKTNTIMVEYKDGTCKYIYEISALYNISENTIRSRYLKGDKGQRLVRPLGTHSKKYENNW